MLQESYETKEDALNSVHLTEVSTLLNNKHYNFAARAKPNHRCRLFGRASAGTASLLLSAVGSTAFTLNAWNLPTSVEGWLGQVFGKLPPLPTSIYLAIVTEITGTCMGTSAVNNYIDAMLNIKHKPKTFVIRMALLVFGISAMLPSTLTAYLDTQQQENTVKIIKDILLITSTLIYGMVFADSAYALQQIKVSLKGLEPLQTKLVALSQTLKTTSDETLQQQLTEAVAPMNSVNDKLTMDELVDQLLAMPREEQYQVIYSLLNQNGLKPNTKDYQKLKQSTFWLLSFIVAGLTASGGLIPTWLGMEKFYFSTFGESYAKTDTIDRLATQGIPSGLAFAARSSLYTVAMYDTANRGWNFIESALRKRFSCMDMASILFSALTLVLISLPTSSANVAIVEAGKVEGNPAVNNILDFVIMPMALISSVILFQMSINDLVTNLITFCKDHYYRLDLAKRKQLVDLVANMSHEVEDFAASITHEASFKP